MVAKAIETTLLVNELESCGVVREYVWLEGTWSVLPLNESVFGVSAAAAAMMAVDCSSSRADLKTSFPTITTVCSTRLRQCPRPNGRRNTPTDPAECLGPKVTEVDILRHVMSLSTPFTCNLTPPFCFASTLVQVEREA